MAQTASNGHRLKATESHAESGRWPEPRSGTGQSASARPLPVQPQTLLHVTVAPGTAESPRTSELRVGVLHLAFSRQMLKPAD